MNKKVLVSIGLGLLIMAQVTLCGATETFLFGSVSLSLGESKETVFNKLSNYKITIASEKDMCYVQEKMSPYNYVGTIQFSEGLLNYVARSWDTNNETQIAKVLAGIFMYAQSNEGYLDAKIVTSFRRDPEAEIEHIYFILPNKTIELSIVNHKRIGTYTTVFEKYGKHW